MSFKTASNNKTLTMKWSDIDPSQIYVEMVSMGKTKEQIPLIRYGPEKQTLCMQCPWIKMSQYGIPPGEFLNNGEKNQYYNEEARDSMKYPLDPKCSVELEDGKTNQTEMVSFIELLKKIDERFKKDDKLISTAGIEEDNVPRYKAIYRKPVPPKKKTAETKEKFYYMKTKFATNPTNKEEIQTEFHEVEPDNRKKVIGQVLTEGEKFINIDDLEKLVSYNCEQLPIIQFVKVWTQSTGDWGITLKLKKCRVKRFISKGSKINPDFVDTDDEGETSSKPTTKPTSKPVVKQTKGDPETSDSSDGESDGETKAPSAKLATTKPPTKAPTKQMAEVDSSEEESSDGSDDESSSSESEKKPLAKATKVPAKATKVPAKAKTASK